MKISKTRRIIGWLLSAIPLLAILGGSFNKLSNNPELVEKMPYIANIPLLGVLSLVCVIIYLIPKTSNIGFFLLCSYLGGAIVGELAMGEFPLIGILLSICLYVGTMLKKPALSGLNW
ncbi:MAG: hypothetical protein AAF487_06960 [Bacteroidota bacterium]